MHTHRSQAPDAKSSIGREAGERPGKLTVHVVDGATLVALVLGAVPVALVEVDFLSSVALVVAPALDTDCGPLAGGCHKVCEGVGRAGGAGQASRPLARKSLGSGMIPARAARLAVMAALSFHRSKMQIMINLTRCCRGLLTL